jgi:hypothetical protein
MDEEFPSGSILSHVHCVVGPHVMEEPSTTAPKDMTSANSVFRESMGAFFM